LRLTCLSNRIPKVVKQISWKHKLIYLLFRLAWIIFVVNTIVLESSWAFERKYLPWKRNCNWRLMPYRRNFLMLHHFIL
jgi:hypothetical protein